METVTRETTRPTRKSQGLATGLAIVSLLVLAALATPAASPTLAPATNESPPQPKHDDGGPSRVEHRTASKPGAALRVEHRTASEPPSRRLLPLSTPPLAGAPPPPPPLSLEPPLRVGAALRRDCSTATIEPGADLSLCVLDGLNLLGRDCTGCKFTGSSLTGAILRSATLANSDFTDAHLDDADLSLAVLNQAVLNGATCVGCSFSSTDLSKASLVGVSFLGANFEASRCHECTLNEAVLTASRFDDALIVMASASKVAIDRVSFTRATIERMEVIDSTLSRSDFSGASIRSVQLRNVEATDANFARALISDLQLHGTYLSRSSWSGARIRNFGAMETNLTFTSFCDAEGFDWQLLRSTFARAHMAGTSIVNLVGEDVVFDKVDLRSSTMAYAHLVRPSFRDSAAMGSDFRGSRLVAADFTNASLTGARLNGASIDNGTFVCSNLQGAAFVDASLVGTDMSAANAGLADFSGASIGGSFWGRAAVERANFGRSSGAPRAQLTPQSTAYAGPDRTQLFLRADCSLWVPDPVLHPGVDPAVSCSWDATSAASAGGYSWAGDPGNGGLEIEGSEWKSIFDAVDQKGWRLITPDWPTLQPPPPSPAPPPHPPGFATRYGDTYDPVSRDVREEGAPPPPGSWRPPVTAPATSDGNGWGSLLIVMLVLFVGAVSMYAYSNTPSGTRNLNSWRVNIAKIYADLSSAVRSMVGAGMDAAAGPAIPKKLYAPTRGFDGSRGGARILDVETTEGDERPAGTEANGTGRFVRSIMGAFTLSRSSSRLGKTPTHFPSVEMDLDDCDAPAPTARSIVAQLQASRVAAEPPKPSLELDVDLPEPTPVRDVVRTLEDRYGSPISPQPMLSRRLSDS